LVELLLSSRCHWPLLALRGHRLDLSFADAVSAGHTLADGRSLLEEAAVTERSIAPSTYVVVCAVLITMTLATLTVSFLPLTGAWHIAVGMVIAVAKASLVVLFFMHVLYSPKMTWTAIAVVTFWVGILFVLTLTDYFTRGSVPYMAGH